jgi:uncharacterized protein YndB with AHSA1/START domain
MTHPFEVREEITIDATPEQVWEAIATGPGIDSWFMGTNTIEGKEGGRTSFTMFGETSHSTVTDWEPGRHFRYEGDKNPDDGSFMAFEYLLEGRDGGSTVLRFVHSGFLGGDGWETEYDALKVGDRLYLEKLAQVVQHFQGRTNTHNMFAAQPGAGDEAKARATLLAVAGLDDSVNPGDAVRIDIEGIPAEDGVVAFASPELAFAVRTDTSLYMFGAGMGMAFIERHVFSDHVDGEASDAAWRNWLAQTFPS